MVYSCPKTSAAWERFPILVCRPLSHEGKGLAESFWPEYAFLASGPLAEAETVLELRLPLTSMLFRIVRSLKKLKLPSKALLEHFLLQPGPSMLASISACAATMRIFQSRRCGVLQTMT